MITDDVPDVTQACIYTINLKLWDFLTGYFWVWTFLFD